MGTKKPKNMALDELSAKILEYQTVYKHKAASLCALLVENFIKNAISAGFAESLRTDYKDKTLADLVDAALQGPPADPQLDGAKGTGGGRKRPAPGKKYRYVNPTTGEVLERSGNGRLPKGFVKANVATSTQKDMFDADLPDRYRSLVRTVVPVRDTVLHDAQEVIQDSVPQPGGVQ